MKTLITCLFFIAVAKAACGQDFVEAFLDFRQREINPSFKKSASSMLKRYNRKLAGELGSVFRDYKQKSDVDLSTADSVFMILVSPDEAPFFCDVIVWSGIDTVSYVQQMQRNSGGKVIRGIRPTKPNDVLEATAGYQLITERDSVMKLVQGRNFQVLHNLGKGHNIMDGGRYSIYLALKSSGGYEIQALHPEKFLIPVAYRKL